MVPYIKVTDLKLGPITLHPFGLLVATGVIVGTYLATKRARQRGVMIPELNSFITWILVVGFMGGHMLDEIFYHPRELLHRPYSIFFLWEGLSSFGGFIGATIGAFLWKYFRAETWVDLIAFTIPKFKKRETPMPVLPFCDLILSVFPVAWIFGRGGCTVVHDHPGARAAQDALLAVAYGRGPEKAFGPIKLIWGNAPQYDLGLLEWCFTVVLAGLFALTWSRRLTTGTYPAVLALAYAPVRFAMDYLRITDGESADPRYGSLTPAQWMCVILFVVGLLLVRHVHRLRARGEDPTEALVIPWLRNPPVYPPAPAVALAGDAAGLAPTGPVPSDAGEESPPGAAELPADPVSRD